jgi:hypothetical protein
MKPARSLALSLCLAGVALAGCGNKTDKPSKIQTIDLTAVKKDMPVAALGEAFKRDFFSLEDGLYAGESSLNGAPFVTFIKLGPSATVKNALAIQLNAPLADFEKHLLAVRTVFPAYSSISENEDCLRQDRRDVSFFAHDGPVFDHVWSSGELQALRFGLSTESMNLLSENLGLLEFSSDERAKKLAAYVRRESAKPVPTFVRGCSDEVSGPLPFPGMGQISSATIAKLGPRTSGLRLDDKVASGWDYTFAGTPGRLYITSLKDAPGSKWEWQAELPSRAGDTEKWLSAVQEELGKPSMTFRTDGGPLKRQMIRHAWMTTSQEELVALVVNPSEGKTRIHIWLTSRNAGVPEKAGKKPVSVATARN